MVERVEIVTPPSLEYLAHHYALAVKVGGLVFCAGQLGRDSEGQVIADPEQQFHAAWDNLEATLQAAGAELDDIVDLTTFHVDFARHKDVFMKVKAERFPTNLAAWTAIGANEMNPGLLVELKAIAVVGRAASSR